MLKKIFSAAAALTLAAAIFAPIKSESTPEPTLITQKFIFDQMVSSIWLSNAVVRTGGTGGQYDQTEIELRYSTGGCDTNYYLYSEIEVQALDDRGNYHYMTETVVPMEFTNNLLVSFDFEREQFTVEELTFQVNTTCEPFDMYFFDQEEESHQPYEPNFIAGCETEQYDEDFCQIDYN